MNNFTHAFSTTKSKLTILFFFLAFASSWGQQIVGWEMTGLTAYGTSPLAPTAGTLNANITVVGLTRGSGLTTTPTGASNAWGSDGFNTASTTAAAAITANDFWTFSITANATYKVSLSSISAYNIRRTAAGPTTGLWQYNIGAGFVDIGTAITWGATTSAAGNTQAAITLSGISALQNVAAGTTITFRIVGYNSTGSTGTNYFNALNAGDDLVINGSVASAGPTVTLAQLTTGIAPSPLAASSSNKAILGFSATSSSGTPSMTAFNIGTSSTSVSKFTNVKLYTSTDNSYATAGDNTQITGFTLVQTATQLQFSVLTEALSTSAKNYFIVADIDATVTGATAAVQPSLTNANVTVATATITGGTITGTNYAFDVSAGTPSISPSGTLAAVNTTYGTASASPTSFTVSGASLTDDIVITPPTGFEISKTAIGSGYASTQTLTQVSGTVGLTTIYVRLANTTGFGTYSGNITLVSTLDGISLNVATVSSTVSKKALTISGLSLLSATKVYDATTTAAITGTASLQASIALASNTSADGKPITGDAVSLTGTAVGDYNSKDVATATTVSYSGLSLTGASVANYSLTAHATAAATITAKPITLSGLTVPASKVYNTTTAAVVTGSPGTLATAIAPGTGTAVDGIRYTGDTATLTGAAVGTYNSANVATATTVAFTGVTLTGAQAGNYSLTAHPSQAATITKATAVITFGVLAAKTTADVPFALTATSTSGNTVTYISGTPATATIAVSTVTIVGAGSTLITASDAGNANYDAATDVSQTLTVTNGPIWSNPLTGTSLSGANPYTTGNAVVPNLTVAGIGVTGANPTGNTNNRYNVNTWSTGAIDTGKYFYFTMTPDPGYEINFTNLVYTSQVSSGTPSVSIRSSVDSYGADIATPAVTGSTVNLSAFQNITSAITFRVYVYNIAGVGTTFSIDDFAFNGTVALGTPVPEINVTQGSSIASGGMNAFGNQENGTSGSAVTFTIQNTGNAVLNLSGTPKIAITGNTTDFVVNQVSTSATVAATSGTTTFTVTFSPQAVGARAAQLSIANDDSNENPYLINLTGTGTTSQQSTISAATFTAPTNIAYGSYQASNITSGNSLEIGKFTLQDGTSDNDSFGTTLSTLTFSLSNFANIQRVALYDGATELQEIAAGATNTFNAGLSAITTTDGGSKDFSIRVTFNSSVTDNQQYQFTVTGATADAAGSGFATANAGGATTSITGNNNRIVVTANRLTFGTVTGSSINVALPSFTIATTDGLGNTDLDKSAAVTLGTSSAFPSANFTRTQPTYALTGGSITISNVSFDDAQTTTLTADATALTQGVSNSFVITLVSYPANSYRTTSAGAYPSGASWERFVSGTWTSGFTPAAGESNFIYIRHAITNASNSPQNVVIETGGTFTYNSSATNLTSLHVETGGILQINAALTVNGTFTVETGGTVNVNNSTTNGGSTLWNGTEDFQDGSTVNIQNWQYTNANRLIENPSNIQVNSTSGNYFGNLIISGNPPSTDSFIVVDGSPTINLCKNNFTVSETGTGYVAITTSGVNATIGGNVIVTSGQFNVAATTNGNPVTTVLGDISIQNGGTLNLNQNSSGSATSIVQLKGNLSVVSGGSLNSNDAGCAVVFSGTTATQTVSIAGSLGTNAGFEVGDGTNATTVQLVGQNFSLTNPSNTFVVKANSILDFNYLNISGSGNFTLDSQGELRITAAAGLNATGTNTGNLINTGSRTIAQTGYFHYTGNVTPQATGNAMTASPVAKRIIIEKTNATDIVNLTQSTATTDRLEIIQGTFVETEASNISGATGELRMSGGTYRTAVTSVNTPKLNGTYALTGGLINLNALNSAQTLNCVGTKSYRDLTFSNGGIKVPSGTQSDITGTVTIEGSTILNVASFVFGGSGTNLTMTGTSQYITNGGGTKPDAAGTYSLAPTTTIEFANTTGAGIVRLGLSPISYAKVIVSGTNVANTSDTTGILFQSGGTFTVKTGAIFKLSNDAGFTGSTATALNTIANGGPTVTLENNSTILYNGSGSQAITSGYDYKNLTLDNGAGFTVSGNPSITGALALIDGVVTTGASKVITNSTGTVTRTSGHVNGNLQRYVGTSNSAIDFAIGDATKYTPVALTFSSPSGSGSVTVNQTFGSHPNISTAAISTTKRVNRYYTLTNSGVGNVNYSAVFNFDATDVLNSADTDAFKVGNYNPTTWTYPTVGTKTATATQATGLTTMGDFLLGECTPPVAYTVTGGGAYCAGSSGLSIGLSDSQVLVNYQLQIDGVDVGAVVAGTGSSLDFGIFTAAGVYSVFADNGSCSTTTSSNKTIIINALPTATISGTTSTCLNESTPLITFTGANGSGTVRYEFTYKIGVSGLPLTVSTALGVATATVSVPTGTARTADYILLSVKDLNTGCSQVQTGTASVTVGLCTSLMNGYRGATLSNLHAVFFAFSVPGATTYRFEITKVSDGTKTVINSSVRSLILSQLLAGSPTGLVTYATEYSIRVAVNNGGYAYGPAYSVFTPAKKTIMLGCGATLDKLYSVIAADLTPYATEFRFKVTRVGGGTTTIDQPGRIFYLSSLPDNELLGGAGLAKYNTSYSISAQARIDGDWTPESPSCTYTTPSPVTYMMQCGSTLAKLNSIIYADVAAQAAEYRFEVSGLGGTRTIDVPGAVRSFNLTQVSPAGVLGQTYSVRVQIRLTTGGPFQAYSAACNYTTPLARMSAEELSSEIFNVKAFPNPFASHFSLDIESSSDDVVEMKVYDMIGRQLEVRKASVSELSVQEIGHNYPSGVYNVIVSQGDKVKSVRMVKR